EPTLIALSSDYEAKSRLKSVIDDTCERINELLVYEPELIKTLNRFSDDRAIRILTGVTPKICTAH
ncbi:MAG: hypothetical protein P8X55_14415, partial [Desulfosarcinaceae bacterium]